MAEPETSPLGEDRLATLYRALAAITASSDPQAALQAVVDGATELLPAGWAALFAADEEGTWTLVARSGSPPAALPGASDFAARFSRQGESQPEPTSVEAIAGNATLAVPLSRGGEVIGALVVGDPAPGHEFAGGDVALVSLFAAQAAASLEYSRLRREKEEFVSVVSHEFKTPLTAIKGFSQLIARRLGDAGDPSTLRSLEAIDQQASRLARLATELVTYTRLESGRLEFDTRHSDLVGLVRRGVDAIRGASERHTFCVEVAAEPLPVLVDPARIQQTIVSLLGYAVRSSADGGAVWVNVARNGRVAEVFVRHEGEELSAEEQARLFRRIYRPESADMLDEGSALGLAIAKAVVEAHGGRIWVESEPGQGGTLAFSLPLSE